MTVRQAPNYSDAIHKLMHRPRTSATAVLQCLVCSGNWVPRITLRLPGGPVRTQCHAAAASPCAALAAAAPAAVAAAAMMPPPAAPPHPASAPPLLLPPHLLLHRLWPPAGGGCWRTAPQRPRTLATPASCTARRAESAAAACSSKASPVCGPRCVLRATRTWHARTRCGMRSSKAPTCMVC